MGIDRNSNIIISDYAHHPSEIKTLMKITQLKYPDKKIILIFQAHQHSRTRLLLKEFLDFFRNINFLILLPIYRQRDSEEDCKTMSSEIFYNKVKEVNGNTKFFDDLNSLYAFLLSVRSEIILFTGAGTIDNIAKEYLNKSKS